MTFNRKKVIVTQCNTLESLGGPETVVKMLLLFP